MLLFAALLPATICRCCVRPTCSFSRDQLSLIDRGWTVAIAHIRGGGDMGRKWYEVRQDKICCCQCCGLMYGSMTHNKV
jgi:hypothetical protein